MSNFIGSSGPQKPPSLKQLISTTINDGKRLLTAQVNLTTTEVSQTGKAIGSVSVLALVALTLVGLAGIFLLITLAYVLVALGLPVWAGFLIVAGVLILIAGILALIARQKAQQVKSASLSAVEWKATAEALSRVAENRSP